MLTREQTIIARNTNLSENFTLLELIDSDGHPELVDWPNDDVIKALELLAQDILQPIRTHWGTLRVNSGYRGPRLNKAVGGEKNSIHLVEHNTVIIGAAADVVPMKANIIDVYEWAFDNIPALKTAILYRLPNVTNTPFIHVDNRRTRPQRQQLEKFGPGDYRFYTK